MNLNLSNPLRLSAISIAALLAGCSVHINDGRGEKVGIGTESGLFSLSVNIDGHTSYGHNRVKGSGVIREESRQIAGVSRLMLSMPADVTVVQGSTESVTISTDDNILPLVGTRVENGVLVIEGDKSRGFSTRKGIKVRLNVKSLDGVTVWRKVRAPQGRVVDNVHRPQGPGKCHRKHTADRAGFGPREARVKRCGKSAPAGQVTGPARKTPSGARPSREKRRQRETDAGCGLARPVNTPG